jgi:hypothetical protein
MLKMPHASEEVSTDSILLDVRTQLYDIALLEECKLNKEETI